MRVKPQTIRKLHAILRHENAHNETIVRRFVNEFEDIAKTVEINLPYSVSTKLQRNCEMSSQRRNSSFTGPNCTRHTEIEIFIC